MMKSIEIHEVSSEPARGTQHDSCVSAQCVKFIDLFAGIGGFHLALERNGAKCVFASEIDTQAQQTYMLNHRISSTLMYGDISQIDENSIPDHDVLCAGFPCQPFSQAGFKKGFEDVRGTLFFDILRIIQAKRPASYFLENVRGLRNHDGGKTIRVIEQCLRNLGYTFQIFDVKASDYGLPQHRPRVFMIGFADGKTMIEAPEKIPLRTTMSDILGEECEKKVGFTLRVGGRGSKLGDRRNWEFYQTASGVKRVGVREAKMMQGFPESFQMSKSEVVAMKQLGNSVAVDAIEAFYKKIHEKISR